MSKSKIKKGYMCLTDYELELNMGGDVVIYPTIKELKKHRPCWVECGIVQVGIYVAKVVKRAKL